MYNVNKQSIELTNKELMALKAINRHLLSTGTMPSIRQLMTSLGYDYPRSAALLIDNLVDKGFLKKKPDGTIQLIESDVDLSSEEQTVAVPLIGTVACGLPILAEENVEAMYPVSARLAPPTNKYFLLRAQGDSMDKKEINDGDLVLVKQQSTAEDGDLFIALIDDSATVKEFKLKGSTVVLVPHSTNPKHQPIILTSDFLVQGVVVTTIPKI